MTNHARHYRSLVPRKRRGAFSGISTHPYEFEALTEAPTPLTRGEVCAGYDGLGLGIDEVFGSEPLWFSEFDEAPSKILAYHFPDVPNYGDMTQINWAGIAQADIISGGTPCQDLSTAGRRAGMNEGTRSNLWVQMREAIATQRPKWVVWENVRGAYSAEAHSDMEQCPGCLGSFADDAGTVLRALGRVLGDLSDLGYDAEWRGLRAADVGSCHSRFRVFVLAKDTHRDPGDLWRGTASRPEKAEGARADSGRRNRVHGEAVHDSISGGDSRRTAGPQQGASDEAVGSGQGGSGTRRAGHDGRTRDPRTGRWAALADTGCEVWPAFEGVVREGGSPDQLAQHRRPVADASGTAREQEPEQAGGLPLQSGGSSGESVPARGTAPADDKGGARGSQELEHLRSPGGLESGEQGGLEWGAYERAIQRWEQVTGRSAPRPTEPGRHGGQRLSPKFTEWMMGVPLGWITDPAIGISRNDQLKACGNGVVPQQAAAALRDMLAHFEKEAS